jgi:hypothetical protein
MAIAPTAAGTDSLAAQLRRQGLPAPWACLLLLAVAGALSRWATRTELVQAWDAGNFVLALTDFDLERHQPHLPGCFWWLLSLGRLALPLTGGNGVGALELVNALASAAALPCGWVLAWRCGGLRAAWWMAALLFSSPLLWFYASQPLSYGPELGWVTAIGCCAWFVAEGDRRFLPPLALLMATAGGIRPNTPLFLLPLVLVCCLRGWRRGLAGWRLALAVALGLGVLVWWGHAFLEEAGGFGAYWPQLMAWKRDHSRQATGGGVLANGWLLIRTIALTVPAGLALLLWRWRRGTPAAAEPFPGGRWQGVFLALWAVPAALYFLLVHFTRMGHATTLLPAVLLWLALRLARPPAGAGRLRWPRDLLLVLLAQCLLFLVVPGDRFAADLRSYDREWGVAIGAVKRFDPATTLVVVTGRSSLRAYRLPSVHLSAYDHGEADLVLDQKRDSIAVTPPLQRVLLLDRGLALEAPPVPGARQEELIPGRLRLYEVPVPPGGLEVGRRRILPLSGSEP